MEGYLGMQPIVCPWCGTTYANHQPNCSNCGGVLPHRDGQSAGPPPPPPPRQLPREFVRRARHSSQFELIFGGIFAGVGLFVGLVFTLIGLTTGEWLFVAIGLPIGLLFGGVGFGVLFFGRRRSRRLLKALAEGTATSGTITEVYVDNTIQVNGRSPWKVVYAFTANGAPQDGSGQAWHADPTLAAGAPVHVVYLPGDPGQNSLYPPLA